MSFTALCHQIFPAVIDEYHRYDDVDHPIANPYREGSVEHLLYLKNWIDTAIEELLADMAAGHKYMKVYKQMKMYNDPELNPVLYAAK